MLNTSRSRVVIFTSKQTALSTSLYVAVDGVKKIIKDKYRDDISGNVPYNIVWVCLDSCIEVKHNEMFPMDLIVSFLAQNNREFQSILWRKKLPLKD